ncbi:hypothetical protein F3Y22_tig00116997pilonHSYRG00308 [Hibiscus syriacus]|uniref:Uncharacterized protein n=1 Tax=Hibiscus syriacus TaxID=106335 RepID=A0A6A2WEZ9_HIBSY|nr:hypothetical protein F3Y22_tig00116997pilonHSYRG00308 [Hibiscus syriacus]
MGDGKGIRFWQDKWLGNRPLQDLFPRIFAPAIYKEGPIYDFGVKDEVGWSWNIPLRREAFDRERLQWEGLLRSLESFSFLATGVGLDTLWLSENFKCEPDIVDAGEELISHPFAPLDLLLKTSGVASLERGVSVFLDGA